MPSDLLIKCHEILLDQQLTISFAESASAGRMCAEFALIPNCGKVLKGGIVCYDAGIKYDLLNVPEKLVDEFTPESAEVTQALAEGLSHVMKANIQVGVTGLTMPGGSETNEKPVGTMFIHAIINDKPIGIKEIYGGTPEEIILQTVDRVAQLIISELTGI